MMHCCVLFT